MSKNIVIAKVIAAFGIKGEVKIVSYCQNASDIEKYPLFDKNNNPVTIKITNKNKAAIGSTQDGGTIMIAKISLADDRNKAESIRGTEIFTKRENFSQLKNDEFYYTDLIGLDVVEENKKIGKVLNILDFGAGTMLEIEFEKADPQRNLEKIENIPFKNEFFGEVNIKEGFIVINLPEIIEIKD